MCFWETRPTGLCCYKPTEQYKTFYHTEVLLSPSVQVPSNTLLQLVSLLAFHKGLAALENTHGKEHHLNIMLVLLHHKYMKGPAAPSWPKAAQTEPPKAAPFLDDSFCSSMSFWLSPADKQLGIWEPPHLPTRYYWATLPWSEMAI